MGVAIGFRKEGPGKAEQKDTGRASEILKKKRNRWQDPDEFGG